MNTPASNRYTLAEVLIGQSLFLNRGRCPESHLVQGQHFKWEDAYKGRDDSEAIASGRYSHDVTRCGKLTAMVPLLVSLGNVWAPGELGGHDIAHIRTMRKSSGYPALAGEIEGALAPDKDWALNRLAFKSARVPEQIVLRSWRNAVVYEDEVVTPAYVKPEDRHLPFWFVEQRSVLASIRSNTRFAWMLQKVMARGKSAAFTPRNVKTRMAQFGELVVEYTEDARITKMFLEGMPRAQMRMTNGVFLIAGDMIPVAVRGYFTLNDSKILDPHAPMQENSVAKAMPKDLPSFEQKPKEAEQQDAGNPGSTPFPVVRPSFPVVRRERAPRLSDVNSMANAFESAKPVEPPATEIAAEKEHQDPVRPIAPGSFRDESTLKDDEVYEPNEFEAELLGAARAGESMEDPLGEAMEAVMTEVGDGNFVLPEMDEVERLKILSESEQVLAELDAVLPGVGTMQIGETAVTWPEPGHPDHRSLEQWQDLLDEAKKRPVPEGARK